MIQIVTDSSALYAPEQARQAGFHVVPLQVLVDGQVYDDYETISPKQMSDALRQGKKASTSQPSIGRKLDLYDKLLENEEDRILDITLCDGLSGTYQSALMARESCMDPSRVHVFDSKTLCGPHKKMVEQAVMMRDAGASLESILHMLASMQQTELSSVTVPDISFVLQGGRLPKAAVKLSSMLKVMGVVKKSEGENKLSLLSAVRTFGKAWDSLLKFYQKKGLDSSWAMQIAHADNEKQALKAKAFFEQALPGIQIEVQELCPLFIVHGGPGCIALSAVRLPDQSQTGLKDPLPAVPVFHPELLQERPASSLIASALLAHSASASGKQH